MPRRFALLVVAGFLTACGAAAPPPPDPAARFSESRYIVAKGWSDQGPRAAEADARAKVAEQIRSQLRSTLTVETSENSAGAGSSSARIHSEVEAKTDFAHGELIETVPDGTRCEGERCSAIAVLERTRLVERLDARYAVERGGFDAAATAAEGPDAEEPGHFARNYRAAARSFGELRAIAREIRVVARRNHEPYEADRTRFEVLAATRARRLAETKVTLLLAGIEPAELREPLSQAFAGAFGALGVHAAPGEICDDGLAFEPTASMACTLGHLGPSCRLALTGRMRRCDTGRAALGDIDFSAVNLRGVHPSGEPQARRRLIEKIGSEAFVEPLRAGLRPVLPLQ